MSKRSPDFEALVEAMTHSEAEMVKKAVEFLQNTGLQVNVGRFIDDFMHDLGYEWSDFWGGYDRQERGEPFETREVRKTRAVREFFTQLNGERTLEQFWAVRPDHEIYYLVHTYNYLSQKRQRLNPVIYLDQVAQQSGYEWKEDQKKYDALSSN
jgi:hypothetical protein